MRTNVEIGDDLMRDALRLTGLKTKRAVVEAGLRMLIRVKGQEKMLKLAGKVHWDGDLDEMRQDRNFDDPR
jgi:Arc/MetJ family transcription regulator